MHVMTQKGSILIVDDERASLHILETILRTAGYRVRATVSGSLALSSVKEEMPDLILLDIMMPGMSGYQLCERFKADERTRQIPIIFLSALDQLDNKLKGFSAGGADYITKPFQRDEVLARVATHLNIYHLQQHLQQEIAYRAEAEKALQNAHEKLELQVQERTNALTQANEQLRKEIETHEKTGRQLQNAYAEIQRLKNQLEQENIYFREEIELEHNFGIITGQSDAIRYPLY